MWLSINITLRFNCHWSGISKTFKTYSKAAGATEYFLKNVKFIYLKTKT